MRVETSHFSVIFSPWAYLRHQIHQRDKQPFHLFIPVCPGCKWFLIYLSDKKIPANIFPGKTGKKFAHAKKNVRTWFGQSDYVISVNDVIHFRIANRVPQCKFTISYLTFRLFLWSYFIILVILLQNDQVPCHCIWKIPNQWQKYIQ